MGQQDFPLVSVIVRTVDRPRYLEECLASIFIQTYPNYEVIIVNDGGPSVRKLVDEIGFCTEPKLIELEKNIGRSASANLGIDSSSGRFVCFIDDDDIFYPYHLETLVKELRNSPYKVAYSDALRARQIPSHLLHGFYSTVDLSMEFSEDYSYPVLLERNYIPILCVLFDRSCVDDSLRFDREMEVLEDWDFWIRLGQRTDFLHVPVITCEYRYRDDGTNTVGQIQHIWEWARMRIEDKYADLRKRFKVGKTKELGLPS